MSSIVNIFPWQYLLFYVMFFNACIVFYICSIMNFVLNWFPIVGHLCNFQAVIVNQHADLQQEIYLASQQDYFCKLVTHLFPLRKYVENQTISQNSKKGLWS